MNGHTDAARAGGRRMAVFGIVVAFLGILCLLSPGLTGASALTLLGVLVTAGGVVRMLWAFTAGSLGKGLLVFALGGLTLLCGIALLAHPLFAAGVLTVVLAAYLIADGLAEVAAGFRLQPASGYGWMLFGGGASILLGIMIWTQFPLSGIRAIGILLGVKLCLVGMAMVMGAAEVRATAMAVSA